MTQVLLAGAGRFAEEVTDVAADAGVTVMGWIEGLDEARADPAHDPPIIWIGDQKAFLPDLPVVPAIGSVARRGLIERLQAEGRTLATLVHPSSVIARSATLEPGCVIFPNVVVGARSSIGTGTILNRGALVGHHTTVGCHSFLGPGANVAGGVLLGEQVHVALAAVVRDDVEIGDGAVVGAGAVAVGSVAPGSTVVGIPARPIERKP
jgi:sugar O-acyltransferase (sialic acid O-acetyltransferase NeuD family)